MFSTQSDNCTPFVHVFDVILLFAAELEEPGIGMRSKGLYSQHFGKKVCLIMVQSCFNDSGTIDELVIAVMNLTGPGYLKSFWDCHCNQLC